MAHVFINMASSADGKITTRAREKFTFGSEADKSGMDELRARADAVVFGAGTLRDENANPSVKKDELVALRLAEGRRPQPVPVLISRSLDFPLENRSLFQRQEVRPVVVTSAGAPTELIDPIQDIADVLQIKTNAQGTLSPEDILYTLEEKGFQDILLEGGGALNAAFLEAGLVNELFLTICPTLLGGRDVPTIFEGRGLTSDGAISLELLSHKITSYGELMLRYKITA